MLSFRYPIIFALTLVPLGPAMGQTPPATRPALSQLDRETRELYGQVLDGLVVVQIPLLPGQTTQRATTRPGEAAAPGDEAASLPPRPLRPGTVGVAIVTGLILDNNGSVLLPLYIPREVAANRALQTRTHHGEMIGATFVGSDRQTNLTVIKLDKPVGKPLKLADDAPTEGSLVLLVAPGEGGSRLLLWTRQCTEPGIAVGPGGTVAGFSQFGRMFPVATCRAVIDQLVAHGQVSRATLGMAIVEIGLDDPVRRRVPGMGARPALGVQFVVPNSPAQHADIVPGDVVLSLAGHDVGDIPTFAAVMAAHTGSVDLELLHEGTARHLKIDLTTARP